MDIVMTTAPARSVVVIPPDLVIPPDAVVSPVITNTFFP